VLRDQGLEVHALSFESPFFTAASARRAAARLGIPIEVEDFTEDLLQVVEHPRHGFGGGMNPCMDCHTAMIRHAARRLQDGTFHLVATGEVLDQRPMSQNRRSLDIVAQESGCAGWLLRPLSALCLAETEPERLGWVDRGRLLGLSGRSRKPQMELATRYGVEEYPTPAGGCRLTDPHFAGRVRDLRAHGAIRDPRAARLLSVGRHFRLSPTVKLIVGRHQADNATLEAAAGPGDALLQPAEVPGPSALLPSSATESDLARAAALCARYCDAERGTEVALLVRSAAGPRALTARAADEALLESLRIA
jgi:hypothetical protein